MIPLAIACWETFTSPPATSTKPLRNISSLFANHAKDPQVKKNYIQLLILKNRLDEAQKLNDEVLRVTPSDDDALVYRGQIQIRQGHGSEAIQTLQTAIRNDPDNGVAHYHLGIAFDQMGDLAHAQSEWQNAVRVRPDCGGAQRAGYPGFAQWRHDRAGAGGNTDH